MQDNTLRLIPIPRDLYAVGNESLTRAWFPRYTTDKSIVPVQPKMHSIICSHQERWRETAL